MKKQLIVVTMLCSLALNTALAAKNLALLPPLLQCQPDFFARIAKHKAVLEKIAPIEGQENYAHFKVSPKDNNSFFKEPLKENGLKIIGYSQSTPKLGPGRYYFWGLLIKNSSSEITLATQSISWKKMADNAWIGSEEILKNPEKSLVWVDNSKAKFEAEPPKGSAEKVIGLYKMKYVEDAYYLHCTIQGNIPDALLKRERPDLEE